jgi:flagellar hook-length control protein FliK
MGTIATDTKTTPSQKSSIALLMKALNIMPSRKACSSRKVSFSSIMNEKSNHVSGVSGKSEKNLPVIKAESTPDPKSEPETTDTTAGKKVAATAQKINRADGVPLLTLPEKKEPVKAGLNESAVPEQAKDAPSFKTPVVDAVYTGVLALTTPISAGEKSALVMPALATTDKKSAQVTAALETSEKKSALATAALVTSEKKSARLTAALETPGEKSALATAALETPREKSARLTAALETLGEKTSVAVAEKTLPLRDFISSLEKKNIKPTANTANPINPKSEESSLTTDRATKAESIQKPETAFMKHVAAEIRQKGDGPSPETILSQVRQTVITLQDDSQAVASSKGIATSDETQKHVLMAVGVNDAKGEAIPFRTDAPQIQAATETKTPSSERTVGLRTQAVIDQIIEAKQSMGNDFGRVRIVLDPPNLGTVDLDIIVRKEHVNVVMTADNASVQQVLQSHADDIRVALQQQNLKIETFQVLLQDNTSGQQYGHSGAAFEQQTGHPSRQAVPDSVPIKADSSSTEGAVPLRGLISVFA